MAPAAASDGKLKPGPLVLAEGVAKSYGPVKALDRIDLRVDAGEFVALLGLNGAGKSTLFQLLSGLFVPDAGSITVNGAEMRRHPVEGLRGLGIVFQDSTLDLDLPVSTSLYFHAGLRGMTRSAAKTRMMEELERLGLRDSAGLIGRKLSGGNRRRVELVRALMHDPTVLLLDEPFNGVDPRQRMHLMELLHRLGDEGRTVLFSSHILEEVERLARHIEVVVSGRHAASGDFGAIRRLMTDRPVQYAVQSSDNRALAAALMTQESVRAVSLRAEHLDVQVGDLGRFAVDLPGLARQHDVTLFELSPSDESLESVFAYLVAR
jgi:ABC-2 type transport system ATP-binding protein